jgi:hypothetical protein
MGDKWECWPPWPISLHPQACHCPSTSKKRVWVLQRERKESFRERTKLTTFLRRACLYFFSSKVDMHNMPLERVLFHDTFLQTRLLSFDSWGQSCMPFWSVVLLDTLVCHVALCICFDCNGVSKGTEARARATRTSENAKIDMTRGVDMCLYFLLNYLHINKNQ